MSFDPVIRDLNRYESQMSKDDAYADGLRAFLECENGELVQDYLTSDLGRGVVDFLSSLDLTMNKSALKAAINVFCAADYANDDDREWLKEFRKQWATEQDYKQSLSDQEDEMI